MNEKVGKNEGKSKLSLMETILTSPDQTPSIVR